MVAVDHEHAPKLVTRDSHARDFRVSWIYAVEAILLWPRNRADKSPLRILAGFHVILWTRWGIVTGCFGCR